MFSRNRYQNILKSLHLVDKKKIPKRNDLSYKPSLRFKPLIDFVNRKFLHYYNPRRELSVDESLVGTKGKTSMLQYIPSKRSRLGSKILDVGRVRHRLRFTDDCLSKERF